MFSVQIHRLNWPYGEQSLRITFTWSLSLPCVSLSCSCRLWFFLHRFGYYFINVTPNQRVNTNTNVYITIKESLSKLGRRRWRQREEPGKIVNQISSPFAEVLLLSSPLIQKSDCGDFSNWCPRPENNLKLAHSKSHVRARRPRDHVNFTCSFYLLSLNFLSKSPAGDQCTILSQRIRRLVVK